MLIIRALLAVVVGLCLLDTPLAAQPPPGKIARIGLLGDVPSFLDDAFRQGLRELGYVEGQNIKIDHLSPDWRYERLPALAAQFVRIKVDVIVTGSPAATEAARRATGTIPIVFTVSGDPVGEGSVASLARPGGNVTGLATIGPELMGKQLEMLKGVAPKVSRVAVLGNPTNKAYSRALREARGPARALGMQLHGLEARTPSEIETAFATMSRQRADGVLVVRDAVFRAQRAQIVALAARNRLPAVYGLREEAEAGGLVAYGASVPQLYRRAATYVDKILKGAKPADLPVEQPTKFELVINLKTAKALGLTIPPSLLATPTSIAPAGSSASGATTPSCAPAAVRASSRSYARCAWRRRHRASSARGPSPHRPRGYVSTMSGSRVARNASTSALSRSGTLKPSSAATVWRTRAW